MAVVNDVAWEAAEGTGTPRTRSGRCGWFLPIALLVIGAGAVASAGALDDALDSADRLEIVVDVVATPAPAARAPSVAWARLVPGGKLVASAGTGVVLVSADGVLIALDAEDGVTRWRDERDLAGLHVGAAADAEGAVAVGDDQLLRALDLQTGRTRWSHDPVGFEGRTMTVDPVLDADRAYVAAAVYPHGRVTAIDRRTGREVAEATLNAPAYYGLARLDGFVLAGLARSLVALDAATLTPAWALDVPGPAFVARAAHEGVTAVAASRHVVGVEVSTGRRRWDLTLPVSSVGAPTIGAGLAAVTAADGTVWGVDLDVGTVRWRCQCGATSPARSGGGAVLIGDASDLVALDPEDGRVRWSSAVGSPGAHALEVDGGLAVAGDGRVALLR